MKFDDATRAQIQAADPNRSTWVGANAGSGKTRVLTDRVARLLLHGVNPGRILCLTYTKAAAAEMQNRLFKRLGVWAMLSDADLSAELAELGETATLSAEDLAHARTLFAAALETPGGLKIQTIHSFCDKLLRRFPLEAGVSPEFALIEDRQAEVLRQEVVDLMAQSEDTNKVVALAQHLSGEIDPMLMQIITNRRAVLRPPKPDDFGVAEGEDLDGLLSFLTSSATTRDLSELHSWCASGGPAAQKAAVKIARALGTSDPNARGLILEDLFLTGPNTKNPYSARVSGNLTNAEMRKNRPDLSDLAEALGAEIETMRPVHVGLLALHRAQALHHFGTAFLQAYDQRKSGMGVLDYDDLIASAARLLSDSEAAQWVLFKLDGGIDHILVDEAQDTSPAQWQVITQLAEEFTSGQGATDAQRTIFVVGDEKQSIYSFQGADPAEFSRMRRHFAQRLDAIENPLAEQALSYSFRSSHPVLALVDRVFLQGDLMAQGGDVEHIAFHTDRPGRVEVWPFVEPQETPDDGPWFQPIDTPSPSDPRLLLADRIADWALRTVGLFNLPGADRAVRAGDILILVQSRGPLFDACLRALKDRGLPVAGADRMDVGQQLAVRDVLSLLRFADLPEDDLSLAEALRSPLFGLSEQDLFTLSHGRGRRTLWQVLRGHPDYAEVTEHLWQVLREADFLRPFELIELILTRLGGRKRLVARLGQEVEDAVSELLQQALNFEQTATPTLAGFLYWFDSGKVEIKREMDADQDMIRVMTVHGAKGLEAPIVVLPDTGVRRPKDTAQILTGFDDALIWRAPAAHSTVAQQEALDIKRDFAKAERQRLLYVALTRAESWLVVCGAGDQGRLAGDSWYGQINEALTEFGPKTEEDPLLGGAVRWVGHRWALSAATPPISEPNTKLSEDLPPWTSTRAGAPKDAPPLLSPSLLDGAKALPGDGEESETAKRRGRQIHLALEHNVQDIAGLNHVVRGADRALDDREAQALVDTAQRIRTRFADLFAPDTLAEVPLCAEVPQLGSGRLFGIIDRLIVRGDHVLAIDFKTNRVVPMTPEQIPLGILRQQAAYAAALAEIYPDHTVETAILWTQTAHLMPIPHDIVRNVLLQTPIS